MSIRSKTRHEGYLLIDNSAGPGVPDSIIPDKYAHVRGLGQGKQEVAGYTCPHCHDVIIVNPFRKRERNWCKVCDHYICDRPACNMGCKPLNDVFDQLREDIVQADQSAVDPTARIIIP